MPVASVQNLTPSLSPAPITSSQYILDLKGANVYGPTGNGSVTINNYIVTPSEAKAFQGSAPNLHSDAGSEAPTDLFAKDRPGLEVSMLVSLGKQIPGRNSYIFDNGRTGGKTDRMSIYLDKDGLLWFRVIDSAGVSHAMSVAPGLDTFLPDGRFFALSCALSTDPAAPFLRVMINNRPRSERQLNAIVVSKDLVDNDKKYIDLMIGADIDGKNGGVLKILGVFFRYARALNAKAESGLFAFRNAEIQMPNDALDFLGSQGIGHRHQQ